ncbi:hypothetical protein RRG08_036795 [Elysia crispata]|uniref:CBM-cenC domain-containing protein n=1 Tax=Elysia crispata TaxID=231223 RepID=A0AAE1ACE0_9GAST|nr:hypothetical protein RRG08_036795 [Elysia crispata]
MKLATLILGTSMCILVEGLSELLKNPGFEQGTSNWQHDGFNMEAEVTHVHSGLSSVKCTGRSKSNQGPRQQVYVTPGGRYAFRAYIQLIDSIDIQLYEKVVVKIRFTWKDDGPVTDFAVCSRPNLSSADGWVQIGADFAVPDREYTEAILYLQGLSPEVSFYFDDASLKEIPENLNWESEANTRIEQLRKSNLHLKQVFSVETLINR